MLQNVNYDISGANIQDILFKGNALNGGLQLDTHELGNRGSSRTDSKENVGILQPIITCTNLNGCRTWYFRM